MALASPPRAPSPMWTAGIVIASVVAITTLAAGIGYQRSVSAPVGSQPRLSVTFDRQ